MKEDKAYHLESEAESSFLGDLTSYLEVLASKHLEVEVLPSLEEPSREVASSCNLVEGVPSVASPWEVDNTWVVASSPSSRVVSLVV